MTMNGCSKAYAMTGWRIGYAGAPVALIKPMDKLQSQSTTNTGIVSQAAAVEALTGPQESIDNMRAVYEQRRDMMVEELNAAPRPLLPQAGRRLLRLPEHAGLHRQDHRRRQEDRPTTTISAPRCWRRKASPACTAPPSCIPAISASATRPAMRC